MAGAAEFAGGAFGGVLNSVLNFIEAENARDDAYRARKEKQRAVTQAAGQADTQYQKMQDLLDSYNQDRYRLADQGTVDELKSLIGNYEPQTYDFDKFTYGKSIEDFIDPNAQKIAEMAGLQTQSDLAGAGAAKGSGALAGMGYSRWQAARDLYKDAQSQRLQDRSQAYQEYGDYIDRMQKKLDTISQGQLQKANLLSGLVTNEQQQQSDYMADLLSILGDRASSKINAAVGAYS